MDEQQVLRINRMKFLVGDESVLRNMKYVQALPTFSKEMTDFLNALSQKLRKDARTKDLLDVLAYAFWIRKSSLEKEKAVHVNSDKRVGRGVAFHIAPSNVPVNFAVSMTSSLLAGNACIIRVSNKEFLQVTVICDAINELLAGEYHSLKNYFLILRYDYDDEINQMLSDISDIRIIWGGNETIRRIRQAQLPPRAIEMAFADRYSVAVIDAKEYLKQDPVKVAHAFYTDTYYSDQNACSSPRLVIWLGEEASVISAKKIFWEALSELAKRDYELRPIQVVDKLDAFCRLAASVSSISDSLRINMVAGDNYAVRIEVNELQEELLDYKNAGGFFFEYNAKDLNEIKPILGKTCQTLALLGVELGVAEEFVKSSGVRGVDRIVEIGKTMELSFRWDGYDMIETMSRIVAS